MIGTIIYYNPVKKRGFIRDDWSGNQYPFSLRQVEDGYIKKGYLVNFVIRYDKEKDVARASRIQIIESGNA